MWYKCGHWSRVGPPYEVIPLPYYFLPSFYFFYPPFMVSFTLLIQYTKVNTIQIQNPFCNGNASYGLRFDCFAVHQADLVNIVIACISACEGATDISSWPAGQTVVQPFPCAEELWPPPEEHSGSIVPYTGHLSALPLGCPVNPGMVCITWQFSEWTQHVSISSFRQLPLSAWGQWGKDTS